MPHPLEPYHAPDARDAELAQLTAALGGELQLLGTSVEGRALHVARIPSSSADARPLLVCAGIHGVELIGGRVALGVLGALRAGDPRWEALRSQAELWVLPSLNPDGYARTWARQGVGSLPELRVNARGVDLNRNFPLPRPQPRLRLTFGGWRTGSDDPRNAFYRGGSPLSEPETAALAKLCERVPFHASANLHSTMGTLIPPHVPDPDAYATYGRLCAAFRRGQRRARYRRLSSRTFDVFTGEQEDYQHHAHGTWALCVEHYPLWVDPGRFLRGEPLFWRFNPRRPAPWVESDVGGIAGFFAAALGMAPAARQSGLSDGA